MSVVARALIVALLLLAGCGDDEPQPSAAAKRTVAALQKGGLTLVLRHALTDANVNQQEKLGSCASQRNLTQAGRRQASEIGDAIRALHIPIGDVRASPMCRARDTARLAFGRVTVDRDLVSPGVIGTKADDERRADALRALAERPPANGKNTVLVTHTGNIRAAFGEETDEEGEMLIFGPGAHLVGRIEPEQWAGLLEGAG
ncbi:MAG TPA: histidine phosphatase family protein [Solirubrobacter sp.]|nr:histidine phosphatase family protein [Solirubrobacter sp.]